MKTMKTKQSLGEDIGRTLLGIVACAWNHGAAEMKLTLANAAAIANGARAEMIRIVQMTIAATAVELISDLSRDGHVALTEDQVFDLLDRLPARVFRSDIEELAPAVRPPAVRH